MAGRELEEAGFKIAQMRETAEQVKAFGARSREMVARGVAEARIVPIEILAGKRA